MTYLATQGANGDIVVFMAPAAGPIKRLIGYRALRSDTDSGKDCIRAITKR